VQQHLLAWLLLLLHLHGKTQSQLQACNPPNSG
jgi:hypothetical protein